MSKEDKIHKSLTRMRRDSQNLVVYCCHKGRISTGETKLTWLGYRKELTHNRDFHSLSSSYLSQNSNRRGQLPSQSFFPLYRDSDKEHRVQVLARLSQVQRQETGLGSRRGKKLKTTTKPWGNKNFLKFSSIWGFWKTKIVKGRC